MDRTTEMRRSNQWHFREAELRRSPSRADGITVEEEKRYRKKTCIFIEEAGVRLHMQKLCTATAHVFFHRFFMRQSFKQHDRILVAATCLFLAGKVEENPKKIDSVIQITHHLRKRQDKPLDSKSEEYRKLMERIVLLERILLHTIAFDLCIEHPYKYIVPKVKVILSLNQANSLKDHDELDRKKKELAQATWNFINDSMRTDLCLQYFPELICSTAAFLSCFYLDDVPKSNTRLWWMFLNISEHDLHDICRQMMELYNETTDEKMIRTRERWQSAFIKVKDKEDEAWTSPPMPPLSPPPSLPPLPSSPLPPRSPLPPSLPPLPSSPPPPSPPPPSSPPLPISPPPLPDIDTELPAPVLDSELPNPALDTHFSYS